MCFISYIIVLNVSIILMMMIAFSNITFVIQIQSLRLYQLTKIYDTDYDAYFRRKITKDKEKKLSVTQFYAAKYNLTFIRYNVPESANKYRQKSSKQIDNCGIYFEKGDTYCLNEYQTTNYAVQQYYFRKFQIAMATLVKGAIHTTIAKKMPINSETTTIETKKMPKNSETTKIKNTPENIFVLINEVLNSKDENGTSIGCITKIKFHIDYFKKKEIKKKNIEKIDKILLKLGEGPEKTENQYYVRQFYRCFQKFKNDVFNIKFDNVKLEIKTTQIEINADKKLTLAEKSEILQTKDIEFLMNNLIYFEIGDTDIESVPRKFINFFQSFTEEFKNDGATKCQKELFPHKKRLNNWMCKFTKLNSLPTAYQYIYPHSEETLDSYKLKLQAIIKSIKNLDKHSRDNVTKENIYTILENTYNNVNEKYLKMMKKCRALREETMYERYVMRLIFNDCRPLALNEWKEELEAAKKNNAVAAQEEVIHWGK
ncbi:uncharacterized protein LOC111034754 isoform X2 [Myzus persicae]|uniref:uncharacterized protein LOC111034754 isoform X2 n=1 Tax=Myzus persicae TaxID=13164 RepID=UPI000B9315D2|nr:uncharacterized protein LOC111034754 isoform X2 [Myzus persicae]